MVDALPHDTDLERLILGWMIRFGNKQLDRVIGRLMPEDFYVTHHADVFTAIIERHENGRPSDMVALMSDFDRDSLNVFFEADDLATPEPACERLADLAQDRAVWASVLDARKSLADGHPSDDVAQETAVRLADASHRASGEPTAVPVGEILEWTDKASPWVLDGMMRQGHRAMFVAGEGSGKSLLLRQIGLKAAAGLHPFLNRPLSGGPVKTLTIDLENPRDAIATATKWVANGIKEERPELDVTALPFWSANWPGRVDLRSRAGRAQVERELRSFRPELLIFGPMYRSFTRRSNEDHEAVADEVTQIMDDYRNRYGLTVIMENHAPHGQSGGKRNMRPVGSSVWLRWPEFGKGMERAKTRDGEPTRYKLSDWRGQRVSASWPEYLEYGKRFPWVGVYPNGTLNAARQDEAPTLDF